MKESQLKKLIKEVVKNLAESNPETFRIKESFGITHDTVSGRGNDSTMNKPTIKESPESRKKRLLTLDYDTGIKHLYMWVHDEIIDYKEFEDLLADLVAKFVKDIPKVAGNSVIPLKK